MKELIGKIIKKVYMSDDEVNLIFITSEGEKISYYVNADCCSSSWVAHISGIKSLLGNKINSIDDSKYLTEYEAAEKEGDYESLELFGYDLLTDKGRCTIEFRNDSNGYYGGWVELSHREEIGESFKEIEKDF